MRPEDLRRGRNTDRSVTGDQLELQLQEEGSDSRTSHIPARVSQSIPYPSRRITPTPHQPHRDVIIRYPSKDHVMTTKRSDDMKAQKPRASSTPDNGTDTDSRNLNTTKLTPSARRTSTSTRPSHSPPIHPPHTPKPGPNNRETKNKRREV